MRQVLVVGLLALGFATHPALAAGQAGSPSLQVTQAESAVRPDGSTGSGAGFTAGLVSGVGFAYRRHYASRMGMHIGGIAWGSRTESFVSIGGEFLRTVSRADKSRFYWLIGTSFLRNNNQFFDYSGCYPVGPNPVVVPCTGKDTRRVTGSVNVGAGIGLEFTGRHVGFSLEVPLSVMLDLEKEHRFERKGIYPIPSAALIYYF